MGGVHEREEELEPPLFYMNCPGNVAGKESGDRQK